MSAPPALPISSRRRSYQTVRQRDQVAENIFINRRGLFKRKAP